MPRTLAMLAAMVGLLLGGCAGRAPSGFAWTYRNDPGEGPKLAYGQPASDNVVLMMTCDPRARRIDVALLGGSPGDGVVLASGDRRQRLGGALVGPTGMGHMIEVSTYPSSAPLARFARTGDLTLIDRGRPVRLDASPLERPRVARFFKACGA